MTIDPDNILITAGSQQGLDLLGKTILNEGDNVVIEEPGYLGAIQAFSIYRSRFHPVPVNPDGMDLNMLGKVLSEHPVKLMYCVPNFQNPSGISYSAENRSGVAGLLRQKKTLLVEDDPYGELRFLGQDKQSFHSLIPHNTVLLGSFSKIVIPSFRIGWIAARHDIMEKLIIAKQASDLHTNYFGQRVILQYLKDNNIDDHIAKIREEYGRQRDAMVNAIREYFPPEARYTEPEGGMFLWITLPPGLSAMEVFKKSIAVKVAFVPGDPFYVNREQVNTLRLNFSSVDADTIRTGIRRLGDVLKTMV
jgi:2-aminoadipate transaminase